MKRNIIYILLIAISILLINVMIFAFDESDNIVQQKNTTLSEVARLLYPLSEKYGIELYFSKFTASDYANRYARWETLTEEDADEFLIYANIFIDEWSKYPVNWVEKSNLKGIAFVKKLNVIGQYRAAMPDAYGEVLYYDIGYGYSGEDYEREVIHHEYYHMIEENYFGDMYYKDPKWNAFNKKGFEYGSGGSDAYTNTTFVNNEHPEGFVDTYSTYGLEEDKAQVYAYLMVTKLFYKLMEWIKDDDILYNKVNYMSSFMASKSSEIDEKYFIKIHKNIPDDDNDIVISIDDNNKKPDEEKIETDGFKRLLESITDAKLKKDLITYSEEGIEKPLDMKGINTNMIIETAKEYIGVPHKFGGASKDGIDCSGLIMVSFAHHGISLPHSSHEQSRYGKVIPFMDELERGDLVFFIESYNTSNLITHVGIYLGDRNFIHTSSSKGVIISSLDNVYWNPLFIFGTRVF